MAITGQSSLDARAVVRAAPSIHLLTTLQLGIGFIIAFEFYFYVAVRQIVNVFEYLLAWRGQKGALRTSLRKAETYDEWKRVAKQLDQHLGFEEWKDIDEDGYFDYHLVRARDNHRDLDG